MFIAYSLPCKSRCSIFNLNFCCGKHCQTKFIILNPTFFYYLSYVYAHLHCSAFTRKLDENISQYYFQIAKIDIVLQSSEFCMIFWDEFKRHLVRKCSIFPAAQSPKLWLKTLCYISRAKLLLKLALVFIIRSTFLTNHLYYRLLSLANEFIITVTLFQIQFDSKSLSIYQDGSHWIIHIWILVIHKMWHSLLILSAS